MSKLTNKQRKIMILNQWVESVNKRVDSRHSFNKYNLGQVDFQKMTTKQLIDLIGFIATGYNYGCGTTRDHINSLRKTMKVSES